jgi:hypothetical protein
MTEPKHLYEKVVSSFKEGREFQQRGRVPQSINWKTGSLFHRLEQHASPDQVL